MEHFEYVVKPPAGDKRLRRLKVGLWIIYALCVALPALLTYLFIPVPIWPVMLIIIAALLTCTVAFTRPRTRPEYEYSLDDGILSISVIYAGRTRRPILELELRKAELIAPTDGVHDGKLKDFDPEVSYSAVFDADQANYFILFTDEDNSRAVLYLSADREAAKHFRRVNGRTVLSRS